MGVLAFFMVVLAAPCLGSPILIDKAAKHAKDAKDASSGPGSSVADAAPVRRRGLFGMASMAKSMGTFQAATTTLKQTVTVSGTLRLRQRRLDTDTANLLKTAYAELLNVAESSVVVVDNHPEYEVIVTFLDSAAAADAQATASADNFQDDLVAQTNLTGIDVSEVLLTTVDFSPPSAPTYDSTDDEDSLKCMDSNDGMNVNVGCSTCAVNMRYGQSCADNSGCCSGICGGGRCHCADGVTADQYLNCPEFPTQE